MIPFPLRQKLFPFIIRKVLAKDSQDMNKPLVPNNNVL